MALQAENVCRLQQVGVVLRSVNIMATEAAHTVRVHRTLNKIVALHAILMRGAIGKMSESLLTRLMLFKLPEIFEVHSHLKTNRPVVVSSVDWIAQRLPLRVTLNADVRRLNCVQAGRIRDIQSGGSLDVRATGSVAPFAADVPLRHRLSLNIVVDGMAAVAQRAGRTLHVVGGVKRGPPVGVRRNHIWAPDLMGNVPLRSQRIIVIASLGEIALLPFAAVHESDVVFGEFHQRIWFGQIGDYRIRMRSRVPNDIRHTCLAPAFIDGGMASLTSGRADVLSACRPSC